MTVDNVTKYSVQINPPFASIGSSPFNQVQLNAKIVNTKVSSDTTLTYKWNMYQLTASRFEDVRISPLLNHSLSFGGSRINDSLVKKYDMTPSATDPAFVMKSSDLQEDTGLLPLPSLCCAGF